MLGWILRAVGMWVIMRIARRALGMDGDERRRRNRRPLRP
jgi:hypothetical protein